MSRNFEVADFIVFSSTGTMLTIQKHAYRT